MALSSLIPEEIDEIKSMLDVGVPQKEIAERFKITQSDVSKIATGAKYSYPFGLNIRGISKKTISILDLIASNHGMKLPQFLKLKILEIIEKTPDHLKREPPKLAP